MKTDDALKPSIHKLFKLLTLTAFIGILIIWLRQAVHVERTLKSGSLNITEVEQYPSSIDHFLVTPRWNATLTNKLPNLTLMNWPANLIAPYPAGRREPQNWTIAPLPKPFDPVVSSGQRRVFQELLTKFAQVMSENGFGDRYFLTGGTLLGSFRHHDMIPWDDDVDILVDESIRQKLRIILSSLGPRYRFVTYQRDKLFTELLDTSEDTQQDVLFSRRSTSHQWGWPFLDISYYHENVTHVIEIEPAYGRTYAWPRDMIFPLYFRPLLGAWYPAPRNPLDVLILTYGKTAMCAIPGYSHVLEKYVGSSSVPCHTLGARYAFVEHKPCLVRGDTVRHGSTMLIEERLIVRTHTTSASVIHAFCLAADVINAYSDTYSLDMRE